MRVPSRYMPSYAETLTWKSQWIGYFFIVVFFGGLGYAIWNEPWFGFFLMLVFSAVYVLSLFSPNTNELNIRKPANDRKDEDIGTFARSLDYRSIDTWVIRAVYEEINSELELDVEVPIRAEDALEKDLQLDDEDLFYIYERVSARVGISDKNAEENPYYDKVYTVEDMILFLNAQPRECCRCDHVTRQL